MKNDLHGPRHNGSNGANEVVVMVAFVDDAILSTSECVHSTHHRVSGRKCTFSKEKLKRASCQFTKFGEGFSPANEEKEPVSMVSDNPSVLIITGPLCLSRSFQWCPLRNLQI